MSSNLKVPCNQSPKNWPFDCACARCKYVLGEIEEAMWLQVDTWWEGVCGILDKVHSRRSAEVHAEWRHETFWHFHAYSRLWSSRQTCTLPDRPLRNIFWLERQCHWAKLQDCETFCPVPSVRRRLSSTFAFRSFCTVGTPSISKVVADFCVYCSLLSNSNMLPDLHITCVS